MTVATCPHCADCEKKDNEIAYLKALIALDSLSACSNLPLSGTQEILEVKQRQALLRRQLLLIRADVQFFNRHVQSVFEWIAKVISVFLSSCGRLSQSTVTAIAEMSPHVSQVPSNSG